MNNGIFLQRYLYFNILIKIKQKYTKHRSTRLRESNNLIIKKNAK